MFDSLYFTIGSLVLFFSFMCLLKFLFYLLDILDDFLYKKYNFNLSHFVVHNFIVICFLLFLFIYFILTIIKYFL